jgi:dihydrodipicolinate synthase/N-acetylneuraminate lyase
VSGFRAVTPNSTKPTQLRLLEYYGTVVDLMDRPIVLHSIPSQTGIEMPVNTVVGSREKYTNIAAVQKASDCCSRVEAMAKLLAMI